MAKLICHTFDALASVVADCLPWTSRFQPVQPVRVASAWAAGIRIFNTQLTKDKRKRILLSNAITAPVGLVSTHVTVVAPHSGTNATLFATQLQPLSPLGQLIIEIQDAAKRCSEKKGAIQKKLELILSTLNRYAQAVDVLIQQHPDTIALAWGAIRMLVTVSNAHFLDINQATPCRI